MYPNVDLVLVENFLQILGAFIGFSIAYISYHGYKDTESPTMLRLSLAFLMLGGGFVLSSMVGFTNLGILPYLSLLVTGLLFGSALLEAVGYFFLAFSHMMSVRSFGKTGAVSTITLSATVPIAALKSVSLYFLLYGVIETVIAYFRVKRLETLTIAFGLSLIAAAEFIKWASFLYPTLTAVLAISLVVKIMGLLTLYVPVVRFASLGGKVA